MIPKLEKDSIKWLTVLLYAGLLLIALDTFIDIAYLVRVFGNSLILGGLLMLIDHNGSIRFKKVYWLLTSCWLLVVIHSLSFIITILIKSDATVFKHYLFYSTSLSMLSVYLFSTMMQTLYSDMELFQYSQKWNNIKMVAIAIYLAPFMVMLSVGIFFQMGWIDQFSYGFMEGIPFSESLGQEIIKGILFIPIIVIVIEFNAFRKSEAIAP